jgi:hypothetical protein
MRSDGVRGRSGSGELEQIEDSQFGPVDVLDDQNAWSLLERRGRRQYAMDNTLRRCILPLETLEAPAASGCLTQL